MGKPRVAIFDFACCEGCQLQIVNMEEEILDLLGAYDVVEWREAMSEQSENYDIAIIEGSITRPSDEERIRKIREKAKFLIALGSCATTGGVNKLKNQFSNPEVRKLVYGDKSELPHLETGTAKAVKDVVKVDYDINGCPIDRKEFSYILRCLALGRQPHIPSYPVCVECKLRENGCLWDKGEICLGPVTRAGCNARCPSFGHWCFGCRGFLKDGNFDALRESVNLHGLDMKTLESRMTIFKELEGAERA
jgi:sulfhydrogenase subunit delta